MRVADHRETQSLDFVFINSACLRGKINLHGEFCQESTSSGNKIQSGSSSSSCNEHGARVMTQVLLPLNVAASGARTQHSKRPQFCICCSKYERIHFIIQLLPYACNFKTAPCKQTLVIVLETSLIFHRSCFVIDITLEKQGKRMSFSFIFFYDSYICFFFTSVFFEY